MRDVFTQVRSLAVGFMPHHYRGRVICYVLLRHSSILAPGSESPNHKLVLARSDFFSPAASNCLSAWNYSIMK